MTRRAEPSRGKKLAPARAPARGRPPAPRIGIVAAPNHAAHGPEVPAAHQEPRRSRDDDPASGVWRRQAGGRGAAVGECTPTRHHYPSSTRSGGTQRLSSSAPECGRENCPLSAAEARIHTSTFHQRHEGPSLTKCDFVCARGHYLLVLPEMEGLAEQAEALAAQKAVRHPHVPRASEGGVAALCSPWPTSHRLTAPLLLAAAGCGGKAA